MTSFDKYAKMLSHFLPSRLRVDVVREVMSDLYAELEEEQKLSQGETEQLMKRVLARHQSPRDLARSFTERRSELIGRRVYPVYKLTLWVSLVSTLAIVAPLSLMSGFHWQMFSDLALSSVMVFAIVTLTFLVIDQFGPLKRFAEAMSLNKKSEGISSTDEEVEANECVVSYRPKRRIFAIILLLCLSVVPGQVGLPILIKEPSLHLAMYPILSEVFLGAPRLAINIWCVLVLLSDLFLAIRRSSYFEAKLETALQFSGLLLGFVILVNGHIFAVPRYDMTASYSNELRTAMNTLIAPYLFQMFMAILWFSWVAKAWSFCLRVKRQRLSHAL